MNSSWFSWGSWGPVETTLIFAPPICFALYRLLVSPLFHWSRLGIPYVPAVPLLGSISDAALVKKPIGEVYADIYRSRSDVRYVGFHKFTQPAILLRDPDIIERVIAKDFDHFPSNEVHGDENLDPMFGRHLFALSGERWRRLRSAVTSGFTAEKLKEVFALIPEVCDNLLSHVSDRLEGDGSYDVELMELSTNFTTSTLSTCALGVPCDAVNDPEAELRKMGRKLLEPSLKKAVSHLVFLQIPWLAKLLGIPFVPRDVTEYFRKMVFEEVSRREREGVRRNDYMQMFIELWKEGKLRTPDGAAAESNAEDGNKKEFSPNGEALASLKDHRQLDDITALALAFFTDGSVTTASVLSFALYELAHHAHVQEELRKEVEGVLKRYGGVLTFDALQEMPFMDMVLFEVMRLYPPAPFMTRSCSKRYLLPNAKVGVKEENGMWVEEGIPVVVPTYGIQRDSKYYPNSEEFNPNRFSQEAKLKRNQFTYYPYGEGPRICIGIKFGLLQAKSAIATLLPKIQLVPHSNTPRPITLDPNYFITISKGGLWIRMKKIEIKE